MKTIQITIDETMLLKVNQAANIKKITRSQFILKALENSLRQLVIKELEEKQAKGYRRQPVLADEFYDMV